MARTGRPPVSWRDWEGREGSTNDMRSWHNASRQALYGRATRMEDGVWFLSPPKRPRTDRGRAA